MTTGQLSDMRVAIVCGHFSPEIGYQEVDLAKAFTRLGAKVRVVTSTRLSPNARTIVSDGYAPGTRRHDGYDVVRLSPRLTIGPNVLGCNVLPALQEFRPTHVILVGPGKLFGLELFSQARPSWQRIAIIQDNSEDGRSRMRGSWRRGSRSVAQRLVKRPAYRRVVRNADRIVLNVPETRGIVQEWLGPQERASFARNGLDLSLGFDPEEFYFDPAARTAWRRRHGVGEQELVLATCTRATPAKNLEDVITKVSMLRTQGLPVRYVLAGVLDDSYGERLRRHAATQPDPLAFVLSPPVPHDAMREMFSAADLGFWPQAAITIQQAMGTGLPVVLKNSPSVNHLIVEGTNGWYVLPPSTLEQVLGNAIADLSRLTAPERLVRRRASADLNRSYLSYDLIATAMLSNL